MDVTPSNRKPSNLYSSTHHLAFESKKHSVSQFPATDNDLSFLDHSWSLAPFHNSRRMSRKEGRECSWQQWHNHVAQLSVVVSVTTCDCYYLASLFELENAARLQRSGCAVDSQMHQHAIVFTW